MKNNRTKHKYSDMNKLCKKVKRIMYEYGIYIIFFIIAIIIIIKHIDLPYVGTYNKFTKLLFYNFIAEKGEENHYKIIELFNNFSISYIVACLFYFIQTKHIRKEKDIYLKNPDVQFNLKLIYAALVDILNFDTNKPENLQVLRNKFENKEALYLIKNFYYLQTRKSKTIENCISNVYNDNCPNELRYLFNVFKEDAGFRECIGLNNYFENDKHIGKIDIRKAIKVIDKYIIENYSYYSCYEECHLDLIKDIYQQYFLLSTQMNGIKNNKLSLINVGTFSINLYGDKLHWFKLIPDTKDGYYFLEHNDHFVKLFNYSTDKDTLSFTRDNNGGYFIKDKNDNYLCIDDNNHLSLTSIKEDAATIYFLRPNIKDVTIVNED